MIDHICHFLETSGIDLQAFGIGPDDDGRMPDLPPAGGQLTGIIAGEPVALLRVSVIAADAVHDPDGKVISPQHLEPGIWIALRARQLLPLPGLVSAADERLAAEGMPFVLYINPAYPLTALRKSVSPQWMGTDYAARLSGLEEADLVVT